MQKYKLKQFNPNKLCLVLDAKYLVYRVKYSPGYSQLSYKEKSTGLYYGFFTTVFSLVKKFSPTNIVFMWDIGKTKDSKRREQFSGYKNRKLNPKPQEIEMNKAFDGSYTELFNKCNELGFSGYSIDRYEADDLIALYCQQYDGKVIIITRDEDMYQLLDPYTSVFSPDDKILKTDKWFENKYGISPKDWSMVKAIGGCKSDTVPGVYGISEEKAIQYLQGTLNKDSLVEKIKNSWEEIDLYLSLTKLPHRDLKKEKIIFKATTLDINKFMHMCLCMGFKQFLNSLQEWEEAFTFFED